MACPLVPLLILAALWPTHATAQDTVQTSRPIPSTRTEMKAMLEDMKARPYRISLPPLTELEQRELGERSSIYVPAAEGTVFGSARRIQAMPEQAEAASNEQRRDFTRNADANMSLSYQFKTQLFWIVSRTNNCQYCLGHQEWKLSATGLSDDAIAALDSDWTMHTPAEQAAFAYARLITYQPHLLSDQQFQKLTEYYSPLQILEMTMSLAGNNAINRWKEGIGIPQSSENTFAGRGVIDITPSLHPDSFLTATSQRFADLPTIVAPLELIDGKPTGKGIDDRPTTETRQQVLSMLDTVSRRTSRLPLVEKSVAETWLKEVGQDIPVSFWVRLIANFPNEAAGRIPSLASRERQTGNLTELQKAQLNWIIARQDRAWYAVGQSLRKLKSLGQSEEQIFALDGDLSELSETDRLLFLFAKKLAASPIASSDEDAAAALQKAGPRTVVQTINHVASCAYFNRITEAAGLPLEP